VIGLLCSDWSDSPVVIGLLCSNWSDVPVVIGLLCTNWSDGPLVIENGDKLKWEVLVQQVVSADQSLARTLYPITNRKTALMLMEQLLSEDNLLMEEHYKKKHGQAVKNPEIDAHR